MDVFTLPSRAIVAIAQQTPATWFKLCEITPFVTEDAEHWFKDTIKSAYIQATRSTNTEIIRYYINNSLHRDNGLPAIIVPTNWYGCYNEWWELGRMHRDGDLPAFTSKSRWGGVNCKHWYKRGHLHRDGDLPAIEWTNGSKEWYKNGKRHRDGDLPAVGSY